MNYFKEKKRRTKNVEIIFFIIICLLAALILSFEDVSAENSFKGKACYQCTKNNPCWYSFPAGDGCNTCSSNAFCVEGTWMSQCFASCTNLNCDNWSFEIDIKKLK